ncbi:MAG: hypothetical protein RLZZ618_4179 [Pseudomonadota bacterium]
MQHHSVEPFQATVDEILALKRLELGPVSTSTAPHDHLPHRLYELGFVAKNASDELSITAKGLSLVRRQ